MVNVRCRRVDVVRLRRPSDGGRLEYHPAVQVARQRHYTLRSIPILRLHPSSDVRAGDVHIEAELLDKQHIGASGVNGEGGIMATQALSAEQLAQLRAQLPPGQNLPGLPGASSPSFQSQPGFPAGAGIAPGGSSPNAAGVAALPAMPFAMLSIRLPAQSPNQQTQQGAQKSYRIEKPVVNIGRQLTNDIIVEDKRVSRYHAQIKYQPSTGQFTIFDLGSTNGITVNGTPHLRQHTLRSGDRFTIGSYDFYFERR